MSDWWDYRLSDFLMFSPEVYLRLFEAQNRQIGVLGALATALATVGLLLAVRRRAAGAKWSALTLAAAFVGTGMTYFIQRYAEVHLAGQAIGAMFVLQGILLLTASLMSRLPYQAGSPAFAIGLALHLLGLAWPLLMLLTGRPWQQTEVFALAPDPTALAALGFVLWASAPRWLLMPVPALWLLFSGATASSMNLAGAWLPLLGVAVALAGVLVNPRRA